MKNINQLCIYNCFTIIKKNIIWKYNFYFYYFYYITNNFDVIKNNKNTKLYF